MGSVFKKSATMRFLRADHEPATVKIRTGETVLETALRNKLDLDFSCTEGTCGSCRVRLVKSVPELEAPHEVELETQRERGFAPDERLSCQMNACEGLEVAIPDYEGST